MRLLLAGALIMLCALAVLLAMVAGMIAPAFLLSVASYAGLFAGMTVAAAGAVRLVHR